MWEVTFVFSGGGWTILTVDRDNFSLVIEEAESASNFFSQEIKEINIKVMED